jgi:hypothetical protein
MIPTVKVEQGNVTVIRVALLIDNDHIMLLYINTQEKRPCVESYDGVTDQSAKENEEGLWLTVGDYGGPSTRVSIQGKYEYSMASPNKYGAHWLLVKKWPGRVYSDDGVTIWTSASATE